MTEQKAIKHIKSIPLIRLKSKQCDGLEMAIKSLEKQIPKNPIPQDEDCLECPNCDSFIGYESECKDENYQVNYCPNCGQAIKWE